MDIFQLQKNPEQRKSEWRLYVQNVPSKLTDLIKIYSDLLKIVLFKETNGLQPDKLAKVTIGVTPGSLVPIRPNSKFPIRKIIIYKFYNFVM